MWTCLSCGRIFEKKGQIHSCRKQTLSKHFENKKVAKEIFDYLLKEVDKSVGKCKIISIPCCIHLFGKYDFMALLPKKDCLEVRFALDRVLESKRLKQSVPVSKKFFKNCIDVNSKQEVDSELLAWIREAYFLKNN